MSGRRVEAALLLGYVLAHQDDFDVRWCRGTIAEEIFEPWVGRIAAAGGRVLGGRRVASVEPPSPPGSPGPDGESGRGRVVATTAEGVREVYDPDVVVMATGVVRKWNIPIPIPRPGTK